MSEISAHPVDLRSHAKGASLLYHIIFAVLFTFGLVTFFVSRLIGRRTGQGSVMAVRQAAHASAGYAVKY